jgi:hypothetical protein
MAAPELAELEQLVGGWQADFSERIVGASAELVDAIEAKLGVALAPEHRAFLERMGEDSDGLNAYGDDMVDLRAPALLEFLDSDHGFDPRAFVIAGVSHDLAVPLLMFDRRGGQEVAPLVRVGFGDGTTPAITAEHTSFVAMLFAFAFIQKCLPRFAWELHLESPGTRRPHFPDCPPGRWLPRFAAIVRELGFVPIAHTGPWCLAAERADAAVMIYECPGFTPDIRVAAHERVELARLTEILSDNLELRTRPNSLRRPA